MNQNKYIEIEPYIESGSITFIQAFNFHCNQTVLLAFILTLQK
ncbi:hypothetical protein LSPH24S_05387 [Lysinibacillus sphaericus]